MKVNLINKPLPDRVDCYKVKPGHVYLAYNSGGHALFESALLFCAEHEDGTNLVVFETGLSTAYWGKDYRFEDVTEKVAVTYR